jgi:hypothetical protein
MLELKEIDQRFDPDEYWIYNDGKFQADTNIYLEYYITKSIDIYKKYEQNFKLNRQQYSADVYAQFKKLTEEGMKFDQEDYIKWMKDSETKALMKSFLMQ